MTFTDTYADIGLDTRRLAQDLLAATNPVRALTAPAVTHEKVAETRAACKRLIAMARALNSSLPKPPKKGSR